MSPGGRARVIADFNGDMEQRMTGGKNTKISGANQHSL
jgi:hypothetical protein